MVADSELLEESEEGFLYRPFGVSGLKRYSGYIFEEHLPELFGERWYRVVKQMLDDATVSEICYTIENLIKQTEWLIVPADDSPRARLIADFVNECWQELPATWDELLTEIVSFLRYGWAWMEQTYKYRDDGRIGWQSWGIRGQDTLLHWQYNDFGRLVGMWQTAAPDFRLRFIPLAKSMLFRVGGWKENPEGRSILRGAYRAWYMKVSIENFEGIGIERNLAGIPIAYIPSQLLAQPSTPEVEYYKDIVTNIRVDEQAGILWPGDRDENGDRKYELDLLSPSSTGTIDTSTAIERYERQIAQSVLGHFLVTGMQGVGAFSLHSSQTELFAVALGAHMDTIAQTVTQHAILPLVKLNGFDPNLAPVMRHGDVETVDIDQLGAFIQRVTASGFILNDDQMRWALRQAGFPMSEG